MIEFVLLPTMEDLTADFCRRLDVLAAKALRPAVALTGGKSATAFYDGWAQRGRPAPQAFDFFWSDERLVPLDNKDSNYKLAHDHLFKPLDTPPVHIHPAPVNLPPADAAAAYAATIRAHVPADADGTPRFPLIVLGLGEDGHTASLFPGRDPYRDDDLLVRAVEPTKDHPHMRLSFTPRLINAAAAVWFVITGEAKAEPTRDLAQRLKKPIEVPALVADPDKTLVVVFADKAAARWL